MTELANLRFYIVATVLFAASCLFLTRSVINIALPEMMANTTEDRSSLYRTLVLTGFDSPQYIRLLYETQDTTTADDHEAVKVDKLDVNQIINCDQCDMTNLSLQVVKSNASRVSTSSVSMSVHLEGEYKDHSHNETENADQTLGNYFQRLSKSKYKWEKSIGGMIQSAFFVGYILLQIPAASLADRYGAKKFIMVCIGGSSLITLITPFFAFMPIVLMISRFTMGLIQSCMFPSCFVILLNWLPAKDKTFGFACLSIASYIGSVTIYGLSGVIINSLGWPSLFWISGAVCGFATIFSAFFLTSKPDEHPFISRSELELIKGDETVEMSRSRSTIITTSTQVTFVNGSDDKARASIAADQMKDKNANRLSAVSLSEANEIIYDDDVSGKKQNNYKPPIPWLDIFANRPFQVTLVWRIVHASMFQLFYNKLPVFLKDIMHQSANANGMMNAGVQLFAGISAITIGSISERLIERGFMERTKLRRFFGFLSGFGQALCLAIIPICSQNDLDSAIVCLILLSAFFIGFIAGAETPLPAEMSKNFGPTVYAIFNIGAMLPGIYVPAAVDMTIESFNGNEVTAWYIIFYTAASMMALATIPFIFFASAERQPFDMTDEEVYEDKMRSPSAVSWRYSVS